MEVEKVILVDEKDREVGVGEKLDVHRRGLLHRAFSIFVFDSSGRILLQRRAKKKYHCGGLWSNTCCSHPRPGEPLEKAVHRRLEEEMGFDTDLKRIFSFIYRVEFDNGLSEHELDHVFIGFYDGPVRPDPDEADDFAWVEPEKVLKDMEENPEKYTYWFRLSLPRVLEALRKEGLRK